MPNFVQNRFLGYNNRLSPFNVSNATLIDAKDVTWDDLGNVKKRDGYSKYNSTAISSNTVLGLYKTYKTTGVGQANKELLAHINAKLFKGVDATGVFTEITVNGAALLAARPQFVTFENIAIFTNSTNAVKKYTIGSTVEDLGGSPPTSRFIEVHRERIWLAGNATNSSELRFTDISKPETFPARNSIQVGELDNDQITGIRRTSNGLLIWKNHSIWILLGNSQGSFALIPISNNVGCVAPHSIAEVNGRYYFLARGGVYSTAGDKPVLESFPIQPDIDDIRKVALGDVVGFTHENRLYCLAYQSSAATDTTNTKLLVLDTRLRSFNIPGSSTSGWTKYLNHPVNSATNWDAGDDIGETYFGSSATDGFVYRFANGTDDAGTNFGVNFTTKFYGSEIERVFDLLYLDVEANSGGNLRVLWTTNQPTNSGVINFDLAISGALYGTAVYGVDTYVAETTREFKGAFNANAVGRFVKLQFTTTPSAFPFIFRGFNMTFMNQPAFV